MVADGEVTLYRAGFSLDDDRQHLKTFLARALLRLSKAALIRPGEPYLIWLRRWLPLRWP
jgi:hypothetical protein